MSSVRRDWHYTKPVRQQTNPKQRWPSQSLEGLYLPAVLGALTWASPERHTPGALCPSLGELPAGLRHGHPARAASLSAVEACAGLPPSPATLGRDRSGWVEGGGGFLLGCQGYHPGAGILSVSCFPRVLP